MQLTTSSTLGQHGTCFSPRAAGNWFALFLLQNQSCSQQDSVNSLISTRYGMAWNWSVYPYKLTGAGQCRRSVPMALRRSALPSHKFGAPVTLPKPTRGPSSERLNPYMGRSLWHYQFGLPASASVRRPRRGHVPLEGLALARKMAQKSGRNPIRAFLMDEYYCLLTMR